MKKSIIRFLIVSFLLTIISIVVVLFFGRTYVVKFTSLKDYKDDMIVEEETGKIEILKENYDNDAYELKVKSKKPGRVTFCITHDDISERIVLYIHKSMIITENNYFGKSSFSEIIPINISIILIYAVCLLIKKYRMSIKDNIYQYKNVAYLGIIIFMCFFIFNNVISIFNYRGLYETINNVISSVSTLSFLLFPLALVTFTLVTISNINLVIKEGMSIRNLLGVILGIFLCLSTLLPDFVYRLILKSGKLDIFNLNGPGTYIYNFVETLVYLSISYLECVLIGTIIIAIKSVRKKHEYNKDYIIILGCQIRKDGTLTPLLKGRVDKALEFRNKQLELNHKDLIFIPSGGKGNDEVISEAEAIKNYLVENGIKEKSILVESKSKNTYENISNSYKLIKNKDANICFSTTNYHVLRAGLIATSMGLKLDGIGSNTKIYFWINAFIREFIGTLYSERKKHILVVLLIIIVIILMVGITYFANNI